MEILKNKEDFSWHKMALDAGRKYAHKHYGEPEKYPCMVSSEFFDDPNGPYTYEHSFTYLQDVVCPHCNHKQSIWPELSK
jgi:hypothetical protein